MELRRIESSSRMKAISFTLVDSSFAILTFHSLSQAEGKSAIHRQRCELQFGECVDRSNACQRVRAVRCVEWIFKDDVYRGCDLKGVDVCLWCVDRFHHAQGIVDIQRKQRHCAGHLQCMFYSWDHRADHHCHFSCRGCAYFAVGVCVVVDRLFYRWYFDGAQGAQDRQW